jgi:hypothetical protein
MTDDFDPWYELYPRKVCRKDAQLAWKKLTPEQRFAALHALPIHVRYWHAAGTSKEFLPYPATWLNGERWTDELDMPSPKDEMGEWWKTTAGIQRKALSLGMQARAGEDWHQLKARILAKERAA